MSVKKILLVGSILLFGGAFTYIGIADAVKTKDSLDFQQVELKSRSTEIQELNIKYDKLNTDLDKASEQKEVNQKEVERLNKEKQDLELQKQELERQLQAKLESKSKLAAASTKAINAATGTATASAMSGGSCTDYMLQAGISNPIAIELVNRENRGCDPCVYNDGSPTGARDCNYSGGRAYGIPQSLPGNKMASAGADWRTNPVTQLRWMNSYVMDRYGSWANAKAHHDANGWY
jgi:outer membrane murein-binding lipoprotein Lpp